MGYAYPAIIQGNDGDQFGDQVTALFPVGQKMELPDNRIFRYAEMGNTVGVANKLYQSEVPVAGYLAELIVTAIARPDTYIDAANSSLAIIANDFAEGYVLLEETDDLGAFWQVAENVIVASGAPGSAARGHKLKPGVTAGVIMAVAASNVINQIKNPWKDIIIKPASDQTAIVVGVTPSIIAANDWGWAQTRGIAGCLIAGTVIIGQEVRPDETVAGAVAELDYDGAGVADNGPVGRVVEVAPDADFGLINFFID